MIRIHQNLYNAKHEKKKKALQTKQKKKKNAS